MASPVERAWNFLRRAPVAAPTFVGGFFAGLVSALAPDRDARRAARRDRFIADWKRTVRESIQADTSPTFEMTTAGVEQDASPGTLGGVAHDVNPGPTADPDFDPANPPPDSPHTLVALRHSLLGLPKPLVATLLGNPPSTCHTEPIEGPTSSAYWYADIWYYPADVRRHIAIAIHFENDLVVKVERLFGPAI